MMGDGLFFQGEPRCHRLIAFAAQKRLFLRRPYVPWRIELSNTKGLTPRDYGLQ